MPIERMNRFIRKLRRCTDFLVCACIFPEAAGAVVRSLSVQGKNTVAERFFLYAVSRHLSAKGDILEIGSYSGSSSLMLAAGNEASGRGSMVWLVEPAPQPDRESFVRLFRAKFLERHVNLAEKTSEDARKDINSRFRLIFIDGDHHYEYVKRDISLWNGCLNGGGIMAFHDRRLEGVSKAAKELIEEDPGLYSTVGTLSGILYVLREAHGGTGFANGFLLFRLKLLRGIRDTFTSIWFFRR